MRPEQNFIGKPVIARALVKKGYISKPKDAFKKGVLLESPQAKQIKKEKLETGQAIDIIRKAGGKAVLEHPIQIREFGDPGSDLSEGGRPCLHAERGRSCRSGMLSQGS